MYMDFHTHGKLAKYLPFSTEYTDWLLREARRSGLDAICLTEHFNTQQFDTLYGYIETRGEKSGDAYVFEDAGGLRGFPGMETDIAEGGHVLCVGPMEAIREMNRRLEPHKAKDRFLPAAGRGCARRPGRGAPPPPGPGTPQKARTAFPPEGTGPLPCAAPVGGSSPG